MQLLNHILILLILSSCNRKVPTEATAVTADSFTNVEANQGVTPKTPACILQKIDSIKKEPVWNPPAEIYEYEYNGKKVYAVSANCCDFFNTVVDQECYYVCAPSGGFTGRGDGKCKEFFQLAKQIRLVWKDERSKK